MALTEVIKELLESGVHFGHLSKHWNPKMKKFIFGKKKNIYIIDLEKTAEKLEEAKEYAKKVIQRGEKILFVATKKQLRDLIREQASSCNMPYVVERWVGGLLTNYTTIRSRIKRYATLLEKRENGDFDKMSRKEVTRLNREIERMEKIYSGLKNFDKLPACIFVVDPKREVACVKEANRLSIPIIALIDTDADPEVIDYPVPGNDDAIKSVRYITSLLVGAIKEEAQKAADLIKEAAAAKALEEEAGDSDVEKYEALDENLAADKDKKPLPKKRQSSKEAQK
ncbi:MAG: 30S ribosomal protein S2 [Candidatus Omnitrophica bacterium]|nr:30S ribosomal protein S2 [Candidatus Omnitrophota bacterium]